MYADRLLITLCIACALPLTGHAQEALEEIIVTAQKRSENLQEAPISIVSLGADALERFDIQSIGDLAYHIPNLSMTPFPNSPNAPRLFIRGVGSGDPQVTTDTSVGVYLDGVYLARSIGLGLEVADIERVEVLRGPQGTLYGRNTTGGAVNVVTVRPQRDLSFSQELGAGELSRFHSKTVLNVPLSDQVFGRLAYARNERDGPVENIGSGQDFGNHDKRGFRGDLRWLASESVTLDYGYDRSDSSYTGYYYQLLEANTYFDGILPEEEDRLDKAALPNHYQSGDGDTEGHTLTLTVDTGLGEFKSISAYRELNESTYQDYSANSFLSVIRNAVARTGQDQFSQELQLVGSSDSGSLDYVAGLYYFEENGDVYLVDQIDLIGLTLPAADVSAKNAAWAAYAQLAWRPAAESPWEITLGGRYSVDERDADNIYYGKVDKSFDKFTPSFTVAYQLGESSSVYGKVVTGYKSGGFNLRAADFTQPFDPETLTSYEIGVKSELLDRRLRLNTAVFYADYEDMQLDIVVPNQPNPALTQTENAGKANVSGIEIDLEALLARGLRVALSYGYLDTEIEKVEGDDKRFWVLQNAPDNQLSAVIDWEAASWSWGRLDIAFDYTHRDSVFTSARPNPPGLRGDYIPSYGIGNLRASLSGEDWIGRGSFEIAAWVHNIFDEEYQIEGQGSFYQLHANRLAIFGDPRLFGVDIRYEF
ncbi:MAG: TonB-dependent receptor [Gammaproteobacteria bacterium]|jgi:iron complex outermembrane receptor protein|nr:TonB-dependent receptor [Gammaproteobacteria bacterium]MBP6053156.1 TonB-dependent receptor [Pseudomonadales bacterium]MBK6584541.1 TonB-dependent receptor [Gammaproteobacteria bacterium]MBK7169197.1 TonB-dependent receptor [Gammaproteobacteria bacterium]MBK7519955.1 TonB-dependent receptor [Gammaproteobacteria bacterium]